MNRAHWAGVVIAALGIGLWLTLAVMRPVELGAPVDLLYTPPDIKPEWYFLWLYQLVNVLPERVGVLVPGVVGAALVALPLVRSNANGRKHSIVRAVALVCGFGALALTLFAL